MNFGATIELSADYAFKLATCSSRLYKRNQEILLYNHNLNLDLYYRQHLDVCHRDEYNHIHR